ncbi:MAG: pilus assembly protein PilM [candidate division Zixibacteria bacterium]|nr:pilus assembly protein PilM [candidate division Zixibacteria bacterium]
MPFSKMKTAVAEPERSFSEDIPQTESLSIKEKYVRPKKKFKYCYVLAFAFNSNSLEMATVRRFGHRIKLIDVRKVYIPKEHKDSQERNVFISRIVEEYHKEFGKRCQKIVVTVSGKETVFRTITLPKMKPRELKAALEFEIRKQIPFPLEECLYDYRPITQINKNNRELVRISVHAITRRYVNEVLTPFRNLGLDVTWLYNTQDVIGQLLGHLSFFRENTNYALLNIGKESSQISYYRGTLLEFTHVTSLGSSMLSNRYDDAKFENFTELLANEIQNSLDYYTGQYSSHFTNRVFVYGDMSYAEDLINLLSNHFGFEFSCFPVEKLDFGKGKEEEFKYSLPVSLAVIAAGACSARLANLIPREQLLVQRRKIIDRVGMAGLALMAGILLYGWYLDRSRLEIENKYLDELDQKIIAYKNSREYDTYNILKRRIAVDKSYLDKIREKSSYLGLHLKELSLLTPGSIRLYNFEYHADKSDQNINLSGVVNATDIPPEVVLAEYVEILNHSPLFDSVTVNRHYKNKTEAGFDLDFQLSLRGKI